MGLVLKENRNSAREALKKNNQAQDDWIKSEARKIAIQDYPDEYIVAFRGKVIEHSKDREALFSAVRMREEAKEDLTEMVYENLVSPPKEERLLVAWIRDNVLAEYRNPIKQKFVNHLSEAISITPAELHDPTGYIASR